MKNTSAIFFASLIRMVASFVLTVFVARHFGSVGMGTFAIVFSLFMLFLKLSTVGLEPVIIREVSKDKSQAKAYLFNGSLLTAVSSVILSGIMIGFVYIAGYSDDIRMATCMIACGILITSITMMFRAVFIAFQKAEYFLYGNLAENIVKLSLGIFVLNLGFGIPTLVLIIALSPLASILVCWLFFIKLNGKEKVRFDGKLWRQLIRVLPAFTGTQFFNAFSGNITVIILSLMMQIELVGYYSAAMRLVNIFRVVVQSYKESILPVAAKAYASSLESIRNVCNISVKYMFILTVPACLGTTLLADRIIILIFSEAFLASAHILRILIWILLFYGASTIFTSVLIASNNQKTNFRAVAVSMVCSVLFALLLIPFFSYFGAAVAVLLDSIINFGQKYHFITKNIFKIPVIEISKKIMAATLIMAIFVVLCHRLNLFVLIGSSALVYLTGLFLLGELAFYDVVRIGRRKSVQ